MSLGTCTCVNTVSGDAIEPQRMAPYKYKDVLVCSGTKCLDELTENNSLADELTTKGMPDLPYIPSCTGSGLYNAVQSHPVTGKTWCTGPKGEYRKEFTLDDVKEQNDVTFCKNVYREFQMKAHIARVKAEEGADEASN